MSLPQTIVAPATPPGEGGIGIVRLSGPKAVSILDAVFVGKQLTSNMVSHHLYRGLLQKPDSRLVDDVMVVIMRAPHSYTGEDVVELHCHGGSQIMRSVLDLCLDTGALMASPGEFTQRAFINGRLDLAQAEAVIEVIRARSDRACRAALDQLGGHLSQQIYRFVAVLKSSLSLLEAHIDFPDDEVGTLELEPFALTLQSLRTEMEALVASFDMGRALREGLSVLLLGRPNVGKSALMNALLGESRSIVTEVAGTTRDTLEENLVLAGFPLRLIDAAGVRETEDPVEREGVRRAREKALAADLVLMVIDGSVALTDEDRLAFELCESDKTLLLINKSDQIQVLDLKTLPPFSGQVELSAKSGVGLEALRQKIVEQLSSDVAGEGVEDIVVLERRHRDALLQAISALNCFAEALVATAPFECLAMDLRVSLAALGQITGETTPDEILEQIFSRFCVGK